MKAIKNYLIILLLFAVSNVYSQIDCPPTTDWTEVHTTFYRDRFITHYETWGDVYEFYHINQDGSYDVKVDWTRLNNSHKYGLTDNELKGFMYLAIIKDILAGCNPPTTVNVSFYEISKCVLDNPCYLKANQTAKVFCKDNLWPGPDPQAILDNQTGIWLWVILNSQDCGFKCCKTTYTVECAGGEQFTPKIIGTPQQTTYTGCPSSSVTDCYFGNVKECSAPCPLIQELP